MPRLEGARTTGPPAREAAFKVLQGVRRGRRLDRALQAAHVPSADRPWVQELTYGVSRLCGRLDYLLGRHLDRGVRSLPTDVQTLLRMGAYQGLYMGGVPPYAAVSETVSSVRGLRGKVLAGLTNAVLRRVFEDGASEDLFPDPETDGVGHLETWGSHPRWLVERWLERAPLATVRSWVARNNEVPIVCVRPFRETVETAAGRLRDAGLQTESTIAAGTCLELAKGVDVAAALACVDGFVQDPAAAMVAEFARPEPGTWVADLCAAPGGKSLALASMRHAVLAADSSAARLTKLRENLERLDASIRLVRARAEAPPLAEAPAILLDVPCTGTGTLRRHPDARWRIDSQRLASLVEVQARMLDGAAEAVAMGGLLVYATCSLEHEENDEQVHRFLARHAGFRLDTARSPAHGAEDGTGILRLTPEHTGYDGAFAARLRRVH
ncbi:MAG: hypothetical protein OEO23_04905 [Gemmatimonadota bacterium]|nr:hypothetical protein [Gemmatimonadota bacterium]